MVRSEVNRPSGWTSRWPQDVHREQTPGLIWGNHSGKTTAGVDQCVLYQRVAGGWIRFARPHMEKILPRNGRVLVIAGGEPDLGSVALVQIVRSSSATHLGGHPAGLKSVR